MKHVQLIFRIVMACLCCRLTAAPHTVEEGSSLETFLGIDHQVSPIIEELIASPAMQRLKGIDQSGITRYFHNLPAFSRYDHSLGVYMLLRRYGASLDECVAGLLHDASHTVFSHVGDFVFGQGVTEGEAYQDRIHDWYLSQQGVAAILAPHGLTIEQINPKQPSFKALEQDLPDMCADRIEYNLHTGYLFGLLSYEEVEEILEDLHFESPCWFFHTPALARRFAELSLYFTEHLWASAENLIAYYWGAEALKRAIALNEISVDDFHFSIDSHILMKLAESRDALIQEYLNFCRNPWLGAVFTEACEADLTLKRKFRGIDPLVKQNGTCLRLSHIDAVFKDYYHAAKERVSHPFYIKFYKDSDRDLADFLLQPI